MKPTRNYTDFLRQTETAHRFDMNNRLSVFVDAYEEFRRRSGGPLSILDIGCGAAPVLASRVSPDDDYWGADYYETIRTPVDNYVSVDLNTESLASKLQPRQFDVIFCGEVIEHLFSPDNLLDEIRLLMHENSILVLSTPNLGYWVNRLLLLAGISPLYLENSSEAKLGRRTRLLGQGNPTEGHIRLFTYRALRDLLDVKEFQVLRVTGTYTWKFLPDKLVARLSHSLAPANVFVLRTDPHHSRATVDSSAPE